MRFLAVLGCLAASHAFADPVTVVAADFEKSEDRWNVHVTLEHPDSGWEHYADAWEVLDAEGNRLGIRELAHPHVNEQPFTRSLFGVEIPEGTKVVYVRARCIVDGWNEDSVAVELN